MKAVFQFFRLGNMLISGVATLLGFWIGGVAPWNTSPWIAVTLMMLLTAFANGHNDLVDLPIDRINRPQRPLPSGRLSVRAGGWLAWGSLGVALILSGLSSVKHLPFFTLMSVCLWVYNRFLKGRPLAGNLCVAVLTASPLVVAAMYTGWSAFMWPPMLFAFLLSFAREIIKDIEDVPGDQAMNLRTLPILHGVLFSQKLALGVLGITVVVLPLPVLTGTYSPWFMVFSAFCVLPPILWALKHTHQKRWRKGQGMVKIAMLGGILAALGAIQMTAPY